MHNCFNCNTLTINPKFCSRSCSASYTNRKTKRRFPEGKCKSCSSIISSTRTFCKQCLKSDAYINYRDWSKVFLADVKGVRRYQLSSRIRDLARKLYSKSDKPKLCFHCGYDKHYEVCHIQSIKSFPAITPISQINDLSNLMALCPNCHWEFDNFQWQLD